MMDDELIEMMARALDSVPRIWLRGEVCEWEICRYGEEGEEEIVVIERSEAHDAPRQRMRDIVSEFRARAALTVAEPVIRERCARVAEKEVWDREAHPESIYGSVCLKIAAAIRKGAMNGQD